MRVRVWGRVRARARSRVRDRARVRVQVHAVAAQVEVGGVLLLLQAQVLHAREQHVAPLLLRVRVWLGVRARGTVRVSTYSRSCSGLG